MNQSRSKAVKLNVITSLLHEILSIIFGLILPRITLSYFGSAYNGLVNSIVQFMSFSVVFRSGLGAVTNAALYKPLAEGDVEKISGIMTATNRFMQKIGWLLGAVIAGFALLYPLLVADEFGYLFSFSLILIIGASSFVENMFSIKYKILLQADQKYYIQTIVTLIAYVLSNLFSVVLIVSGFGIHIVKIGSLIGLTTTPFLLKLYVDRHYTINWKQKEDNSAVKSRWDAFAQQLASIFNSNIATILITFLFPLKEVSVYTVYQMVVKNINQLITSALVGIKSAFGNMLARQEDEHLRKRFRDVEWIVFAGGAVLYTVTGILLTPFVLIYTQGIFDADYNRFAFGFLMTMSCYIYITRLPYQMITEAAGYFRETRNSAYLEILTNIITSLIFVQFLGLNGILLGALFGTVIRVGHLMWIACRKFLCISLWSSIRNGIVYFGTSTGLIFLVSQNFDIPCDNFGGWVLTAVPVFFGVSAVVLIVSMICNRTQCISILKSVYTRKSRKR